MSLHTRMLMMAAAALVVLSGCDGGGNDGAQASPSAGKVTNDSAREAWLEAAKCMRENGYPTFPDPTQNSQGVWEVSVPIDGPGPDACQTLIRRAKVGTNSLTDFTPQEMSKRRQYAKCMRDNGLQGFPDPDEQGNFGPLTQFESSPGYAKAKEACKQWTPAQIPKGAP